MTRLSQVRQVEFSLLATGFSGSTKGFRGHTGFPVEDAAEVSAVGKADHAGDFGNGVFVPAEQASGAVDSNPL